MAAAERPCLGQTKTQEQVNFTEAKPALVNTIRQQPARVVTHGVHGDA